MRQGGLQVEELTVSYGPVQALKGISFEVEPGQVVAIVGANGAGKTTLLSAISGLIKPRAGRILFDGQEVTAWPSHRIVQAGIVQVPEGRAILGSMTVEENLELGAFSGNSVAEVEGMLQRFPILRERRGQPAAGLSGGEQQMLAIARGLLQRPKLLLLDEPSMGLAPLLVNQVFDILREIHEQGTTILLVEQNARKALALANRAFVLEQGQIVLSGTGQHLLTDEAVVRAYIGSVR
ncbi:MAG TPA: ABC transporter ATP-binding protein [Chloroflexota bacterium]|nr:ABC transporter ATP-binding protein [Chloroflexota bacterium]